MKIGILGSGNVGGGLARLLADAGHEVQTSTRETLRETAEHGDAVILAVPGAAAAEVVSSVAPLAGKVLVDATNFGPGAQALAELVPKRTSSRRSTPRSRRSTTTRRKLEPPASHLWAGPEETRDAVETLVRDVGFEPVYAGGIEKAADIDAFARLNIGIAYEQGRGPFAYRFMTPS